MPVKSSSNNRILPANSRAVDVAIKAIDEITPVQQTRIANAFKPQGSQGILYNRLEQGIKCTCGANAHSLASRLDQDGKLSNQEIAQMLTGTQFGSDEYFSRNEPTITSPDAPVNKHHLPFFNDTHGNTDGLEIPLFQEESLKDDGAKREQTLDDIVGAFDVGMLGITDVACPVCFGSGMVGGFTALHSYRAVFPINSQHVRLDAEAQIDYSAKPWKANVNSLEINVLIPKGIVGIDACRMFYMEKIVPARILLNGLPATDRAIIQASGTIGKFRIEFNTSTIVTHFEFQAATSTESAYFELPKLQQSPDLSQIDSTVPFQVLLSPDIPRVFKQDVIVEAQYGRALIVGTVSPWSTRQKHNLGYEVEVRVAQPQELYNILPRRGRTLAKYQSTIGVHDNGWGRHRT